MSTDPQQQKDVEFYAAAVAAWLNTSLEYDKSIFALSAGGIGLLITLLTTVGVANAAVLVLYITAIIAFFTSLICILAVFRRNRAHIEQVVLGNRDPDPLLSALDRVAVASFGAGALLAAIIGVSTAITSYSTKERAMATENKQLQSVSAETRSFNGLGGLKPQETTAAPAQAPAQTQAPAPPPPAESSSSAGK